jgi:hypothetical protein
MAAYSGGDSFVGCWTLAEAQQAAVEQIAASGCGATAVATVLRALLPPHELARHTMEALLAASTLRVRANDAPLPQYLASRAVAGCTGQEIVDAISVLEPRRVACEFLPTFHGRSAAASSEPSGTFSIQGRADIIEWLYEVFCSSRSGGNRVCVVATLNLQLLGNDAWHHQLVFGVDRRSRRIFCCNPIGAYDEATFVACLSTPSILRVRAADVRLRAHRSPTEGGPVDDSVYDRPEWRTAHVREQVEACCATDAGHSMPDHHDLADFGPHDVHIPAVYECGLSVFRTQATESS